MPSERMAFRPQPGQTHSRYVFAFTNGAVQRGDFTYWDTTAPTAQGSSGVLEGKTLGTEDFIYVKTSTVTAGTPVGLQAGVIEGPTIGSRDTVTAMADDSLVCVQTWGIHNCVQVDATTPIAGSYLVAGGATAGVLKYVSGTAAISTVYACELAAIAMMTAATYTRGTVTNANKVVAFVRCNF